MIVAKLSRQPDVGFWHKCEVPTVSGNVRVSCGSGLNAELAGHPPL